MDEAERGNPSLLDHSISAQCQGLLVAPKAENGFSSLGRTQGRHACTRGLLLLPPSPPHHDQITLPGSPRPRPCGSLVRQTDTTSTSDQRSSRSPFPRSPNTQIKTFAMSASSCATAQVPASPAPSPAISRPPVSLEPAPKAHVAAEAVAPKSSAVDHILLTPRLDAILESYSKEGQGDAELLKLILQAKAREDEVSLRSPYPALSASRSRRQREIVADNAKIFQFAFSPKDLFSQILMERFLLHSAWLQSMRSGLNNCARPIRSLCTPTTRRCPRSPRSSSSSSRLPQHFLRP